MQAQQPFVYKVVSLAQVLPKIKASTTLPDGEKKKLEELPPATPIVVQTPVQLGKLQGDRYPLISGLQRGERVVVSNTALLRTGLPVKIGPAAAN
jgi:multidrug efflux pump subunit AcrA (membrane-fusion protein)